MAGGRPTKYSPKFNKQVEKLSRLGATDAEIADFLVVDVATLNRWKKKYPKFCTSIKAGKIQADANVAESLYKRAIGYSFKEVTYEKIDGKEAIEALPDGELVKKDTYRKKIIVKELAPDVVAGIFWLKNRRGKVEPDAQRWADKQEVTGENGAPINHAVALSSEELKRIAEALENKF